MLLNKSPATYSTKQPLKPPRVSSPRAQRNAMQRLATRYDSMEVDYCRFNKPDHLTKRKSRSRLFAIKQRSVANLWHVSRETRKARVNREGGRIHKHRQSTCTRLRESQEGEKQRQGERERELKAISHLFTRPPGTDVLARVPPRVCTGSRAGYRLDKYKQSLNNASAVPALGSKQVT